jgi:hypothetical protein
LACHIEPEQSTSGEVVSILATNEVGAGAEIVRGIVSEKSGICAWMKSDGITVG